MIVLKCLFILHPLAHSTRSPWLSSVSAQHNIFTRSFSQSLLSRRHSSYFSLSSSPWLSLSASHIYPHCMSLPPSLTHSLTPTSVSNSFHLLTLPLFYPPNQFSSLHPILSMAHSLTHPCLAQPTTLPQSHQPSNLTVHPPSYLIHLSRHSSSCLLSHLNHSSVPS